MGDGAVTVLPSYAVLYSKGAIHVELHLGFMNGWYCVGHRLRGERLSEDVEQQNAADASAEPVKPEDNWWPRKMP